MTERTASALVVAAIALGLLWVLRPVHDPAPGSPAIAPLLPDMVPLVTGGEPIVEIFTRSGCSVCRTIPGIKGADGRVGPPLLLGSAGAQRLRDPAYQGKARTIHEYIIESVIEPGVFVVPSYPPNTMPTWYGAKLSALALEQIASYLERQTGEPAREER